MKKLFNAFSKTLSLLTLTTATSGILASPLFLESARLYSETCLTTPEEPVQYDFNGTHFVASYKGCDEKALRNIDSLRYAMIMAAHDSNAKVLSHNDFRFSGDGYTMVVLLSESHASIHTYPEHNACFVDLFTCGTRCSWENFDKSLRAYLQPTEVDSSIITRK